MPAGALWSTALGSDDLHLNTGHGTLGWTMACGSACVLADILSGRKPEIDTTALAMSRYDDRFG